MADKSGKYKNLNHTLTVEEQRRGGQHSAESRAESRTIQAILNDFLAQPSTNIKAIDSLSAKLGLKDKSIKEIVSIVLLLNTLKSGRVQELEKLCEVIGEGNIEVTTEEEEKQDKLLKAIKKAVRK